MPKRAPTSDQTEGSRVGQTGPVARRAREAALDRAAPRSILARRGIVPTPEAPAVASGAALDAVEMAAYARGLEATKRERQDLRRKLGRLEAQNETLRSELAAALARVDALEAERAALRASPPAPAPTAQPSGEPTLAPAPEPSAPAWIGGPPPLAAPAIVGRAPAPTPRAAPIVAPEPAPQSARITSPPPRPTPPAPDALQAPRDRGRVDLGTPLGALLIKAPAPGGRAAGCFAELLERAAGRLTADLARIAATEGESLDEARRSSAERRLDTRPADDLRALACLYRGADGLYRTLALPPSNVPPLNGDLMRQTALSGGSSPAAACVEAAHG